MATLIPPLAREIKATILNALLIFPPSPNKKARSTKITKAEKTIDTETTITRYQSDNLKSTKEVKKYKPKVMITNNKSAVRSKEKMNIL